MNDLRIAMLAPLLTLILLLAGRRCPEALARIPRWSSLLYLLPFAISCAFTFPSLDDWCYGASGHHRWWAAQQDWYIGWSGRITTTAIITTWGDLGSPWFAAVIGYRLVITSVFAATCWALWDLLGALVPEADRNERGMLTLAAAAGWICLLSDPAEGLFWLPGVASYSVGALFALMTCSAILRGGAGGSRWWWWLAFTLLPFACLCSEVIAALTLSAVAGLVAVQLRGRDRCRGLTVLAGGMLATTMLLLAPGNAVRALEALKEGQPPVDHAPGAVIGGTAWQLWRFIGDAPWSPLAALGAWIAWNSPARRPLHGTLMLLLIPGFALAAALPMAWAGMSPGRAWNPLAVISALVVVVAAWRGGPRLAPLFLVVAALVVLDDCAPGLDGRIVPLGTWIAVLGGAWILRRHLDHRLIAAALAGGLLLGSDRFVLALSQLTRGPAYAMQQQRRIATLVEAAPGSAVEVPRLKGDLPYLYHLNDIDFSPKTWQNQGCAAFFGLESVRAARDEPLGLALPGPQAP